MAEPEYTTKADVNEMIRAVLRPDDECAHNFQPLVNLVRGLIRREAAKELESMAGAFGTDIKAAVILGLPVPRIGYAVGRLKERAEEIRNG